MNLNDLLRLESIDPAAVLVLRHRPQEPEFRKVFPWLAAEKPEIFNAYQQTQNKTVVEGAMKRAKYVAAFIGHESGKALFVGLYQVAGHEELTHQQYWDHPLKVELRTHGHSGASEEERPTILWFDLHLTDFYARWKGKLVVSWPPPERSWWRWAHRNDMAVLAIHEESLFDGAMPHWDSIDLTWDQMRVLPARYRIIMSEWRVIYFIYDMSDGKGYVGSAYGQDNLLGRWQNYASDGHGGNVLLKSRDPRNFRFTILERVSPDMEAREVIRLERSWKERLHTLQPFGLNTS